MSSIIVGIDLGTTNSELACIRDGKVEVIPIHGGKIMPSCVGLDASGQLIVGQKARNQLVAAPESTLISIKRRMGEAVKVPLGSHEFSPEEVSSFILKELKTEAEKVLGEPVTKAVITVPAFFNEHQRKATQIAGELAGLEVVRILNEPTAAALAYDADKSKAQTLVVYDLGGGTFDVSVVVVQDGVVEVRASRGDTHLGGDDFDQLLVDHAVRVFEEEHGVNVQESLALQRRLKVVLEQAKRRLSDEAFVTIREEYLDGEHHLEMEITRQEYERMILPLVERTLECVQQALVDANVGVKAITKVLLVGGASRTPLVQQLLIEQLGQNPHFEVDPDLIVAMGAAVQAGILSGAQRESILVDITAHTLSTGALTHDEVNFIPEKVCVPILPRNTPLPTSRSEMFTTFADNATKIEVEVYQGEGRYPKENTLIGKFMVEGLSKAPAGNPILIGFSLDLNGMLTVTAREKVTGLTRTVTMDIRGTPTLDLDEARSRMESMFGGGATLSDSDDAPVLELVDEDQQDGPVLEEIDVKAHGVAADSGIDSAEHNALLTEAKNLRKRTQTLLESGVPEEDAAELNQFLHTLKEAIQKQDWATARAVNIQLSDLLFYLED